MAMAVPKLFDNKETPIYFPKSILYMWERIGFFIYLLTSLFFDNYYKYLLIAAVVNFLVIYSLYLYNFLRDSSETDCNKMEAISEGVENIYLSDGQRMVLVDHLHRLLRDEVSKRKEIESKLEEKLRVEKEKMNEEKNKLKHEFKEETMSLVEQLRVLEEEIQIMAKEKRDLVKEFEEVLENVSKLKQPCKLMEKASYKLVLNSLDLKMKCKRLEEEKVNLGIELERERFKVSELEEMCTRLEEDYLDEERLKVSELKEMYTGLEEVNYNLRDELHNWIELHKERLKVLELEERCTSLEEENGDLGIELDEERSKVSELEEKCMRLEEDNGYLGIELDNEREAKKSARKASEQVMEVREMLMEGLLAKNTEDEKIRKLKDKINKKSRMEKKYKKLKMEKKIWEVEREKLLNMLENESRVVAAYKDMLDKEECLMKAFEIGKFEA
ncbi:uncharacterized protein LOC141602583 [Silene latifolia]|uniref:uncharacterized protein LOC141602583 n=1 Tax=Silene latifolia TaxID=37657 RepID=UPI003D7845EB